MSQKSKKADQGSSAKDVAAHLKIGVDIGGTFTDFVLHDMLSGALHTHKILTTPENPSEAVLLGLASLMHRHGFHSNEMAVVLHATTLATNTLIEGKGAKVGLITTEGFRDILEMRRETRFDDYDLSIKFPSPLVPRNLCHEVPERVLADGTIRTPLNEDAARRVIQDLKDKGVAAIAICLINSWATPEHEQRLAELAAEVAPDVPVSVSCRVQPEIREYERMNTTAANAYIQPRIRRYVERLRTSLDTGGYTCPLYIMQSNGGFAGPAESSEFPVRLIESGPAAGALAAAVYGRRSGDANLISFDMGGTTAKIAVLTDGEPRVTTELEVARTHRFKPGSGYPIKCPSIELTEIGAGGGSIATVNALGLIRVGPESASSVPGPACYGRGGQRPTVTDADLILGYLAPGFFAGGTIRLDRAAAEAAIEAGIAKPCSMTVVDAAWGIHEIVNENMATAARLHVLQRGEDPRNFAFVAFGGAGPVHAHRVARKLGISRIIYPLGAGVASAYGLTTAPMSTDLVRSYVTRLAEANWATINKLFVEMESEGVRKVSQDATGASELTRLADMRYIGQGYEIQVVLPEGPYDEESGSAFEQAFFATYQGIFGRRVTNVPVQLVNLRLYARGARPEAPLGGIAVAGVSHDTQPGKRPVYFGPANGFVECAVYRRNSLARGTRLKGPAILEENETTVVMEPDAKGFIDESFNLIVTIPGGVPVNRVMEDSAFGPVELEIAWGRLIAIQDESALALVRTSFSTIVREAQDYTVILLDREGRSVAQPSATAPAFTGTMPRTMQHFLKRYPLETWQPGDLAITNDPWMGTGHLNDVNIARPIFHDGRLVAFVGLVAHTADIGGNLWSAGAQEVYEEGLQIPISKLYCRGEPNEDVFNFIRTNVRLSDIVIGDLHAMNSAAEVVDRRLNDFLSEFGGNRWESLVEEIIQRTERAIRDKLRQIPEGVYRHKITLDGYGEPLTVAGTVTVSDGGIHIDYSGTSAQVPYAMNAPYTYTYAYTCHPLKCVIDPLIPNNEGTFRAISVTAPEGTIVNPRYPAAVGARNLTGQTLYAVLLGALAPAIPDRVIAEGSSPRPTIIVSGFRADGQRFQNMFFIIGGLGARKGADGMPCLPFPTNTKATPVEVMETTTPVLVERKFIVPDTGGIGTWRGGPAQEIVIRNLSPNPMRLSVLCERTLEAPQGVFGGGPGGTPAFFLEDGTPLNSKGITVIKPSQSFVIRTHGGAGYGAPAVRDVDRIRSDLEQGYVTAHAMRRDYGFAAD